MSSFDINKIIAQTAVVGDGTVVNQGIAGPDVLGRLASLVASQQEARELPAIVVEDIETVRTEIEEGRGTSEQVRTRLERIRNLTENATAWALVGGAAVELMQALGLT